MVGPVLGQPSIQLFLDNCFWKKLFKKLCLRSLDQVLLRSGHNSLLLWVIDRDATIIFLRNNHFFKRPRSQIMTIKTKKNFPILTMMSNTILFGVAAGLLGYCWLKFSIYTPLGEAAENIAGNAWWTLNEKLMLSTLALLLGGFFHSILILYPEYLKKDEEVINSNRRAKNSSTKR